MRFGLHWIFIFFISAALFASEQPKNFTLEKAIQRALDTNRDLKIARLEKERARQKYREAFSATLPQINAGINVTRNLLLPFFYLNFPDSSGRSVARKIEVGYNWQYGGIVNLQQTLYTFGRVGAGLEIADYYDDATKNQYFSARENLIEQTYLAYNLVHLARIKVKVVSFSFDVAKKNYELVKHRYNSGLVSEFELLQAKVNMENLEPQVIEAKSELERAKNNLKVVLNLPLDTDLTLTDSLRILEESVPVSDDEIWNRYDYKARQWRVKMFEKRKQVEFSYHLPTLNADAQYQFTGANDILARNKDIEGETFKVGVNFNIPVFTGFRTQAQYEQAVIDYEQERLRLAQQHDAMKMEFENAKLRLQAAKKRLVASNTSRTSAEKALQIAAERKKAGSITELDFQNAQIQYENSQRNYYKAVYDYNKAYIDLLKSVGKLGKLFPLVNEEGNDDE